MLIFDNDNKSLILDNIYTPIVADSFWVLDLNIMDFTLAPLIALEELVCSTIEVSIGKFRFNLPTMWNILVVDPDTMQLDVVQVSELAGKQFSAFVYGPNAPTFECALINVTDYFSSRKNVGPTIAKHQMLCHPISPAHWVSVAPSDTYNKYFKDKTAGDLI